MGNCWGLVQLIRDASTSTSSDFCTYNFVCNFKAQSLQNSEEDQGGSLKTMSVLTGKPQHLGRISFMSGNNTHHSPTACGAVETGRVANV